MKIMLAYIMVPHLAQFQSAHSRFISSYLSHPPGEHHSTVIICNGREPDSRQKAQFSQIADCSFFTRTNDGWDIGGYLDYSKQCDADMILCFGASAYFNKPGWLSRMAKVFAEAPGLYGTCASYQIRPHLNTSGFFCPPHILRRYPFVVSSKSDRYAFEHGPNSLWVLVAREKLPVKLVLWSGEYQWREWRRAPNCFWRGDQSNCLAFWRPTEDFSKADMKTKRVLSGFADTLTDPYFKQQFNKRKGAEI